MTNKKGLFFPDFGEDNIELGKKFLSSPKNFAKEMGLNLEDLHCSDNVHKAFTKAELFSKDVRDSKITPDDASMVELKNLAQKHLGLDYEVSLIPFGLRFKEKLNDITANDITATASGTVTFLDSDADVDG